MVSLRCAMAGNFLPRWRALGAHCVQQYVALGSLDDRDALRLQYPQLRRNAASLVVLAAAAIFTALWWQSHLGALKGGAFLSLATLAALVPPVTFTGLQISFVKRPLRR